MKSERNVCLFLLIFVFTVFFSSTALAQSNYVLPYPSSMPGSLFYKVHLIYESTFKHWYFGDFGQFNYNLKMADKYLVEAKTLFEYKQYLLGYKALEKSNKYFISILPNLLRAKENGKNIIQKKSIFDEAAKKHIEILNKIKDESPNEFNWRPEKSLPTNLNIGCEILSSIEIRRKDL